MSQTIGEKQFKFEANRNRTASLQSLFSFVMDF